MGKYTVIVAEKPSVAKGIAKLVGATKAVTQKANGYLEGNGYRVTWAFGHLVGLKNPEAVGLGGNILPIVPERWETDIIQLPTKSGGDMNATIAKQMKILDELFASAGSIIEATDAGREGELIFRYIYEYLGHNTPFSRLWISSLTDEAIRKGMNELRPGSEFDALSDAAHSRSEADWLLGYNASRALTLMSGSKTKLSLGRVQTPVLCMICNRFDANKNFVPTPFWQVQALVHKEMDNFQVVSIIKYQSEAAAKEAAERARASMRMRVTKLEKKQVTSKPPLLYDLTALQRAANSKLGLTADQTLKIAQELYEKKYLTYPRTGSRYISEDVYHTIPSLLQKIQGYARFSEAAAERQGKKLCRRSVDDTKVTDHHALLPTTNIPKDLEGNLKSIWEMVCARTIEAFGEDSLSERTSVEFDCGGTGFKATGSIVTKAGWKSVLGVNEAEEETKKNTDENGNEDAPAGKLPPLNEGEVLPAGKIETVRKTDQPLPIYTDGSLLAEMETCGKRIEDEELRESMKDVGLGTPATRAQHIERLIQIEYIVRKGKKLIPTDKGTAVWKMVRHLKIADVRTSAEWERDLGLVEQGKKSKKEFDRGILQFTLEVIEDIRKNVTPMEGVSGSAEPQRTCPICGRPMRNMKFSVTCNAENGGCGFKISREIAGKKLPATAIEALAQGKRTAVLKGFKSKSGSSFDASLEVDRENHKVAFYRDRGPVLTGRACPVCQKALTDDPWKLSCECGFKLYKTQGEVKLTTEQLDTLLGGGAVALFGMKGKNGKKYNARISLNLENGQVEREFINDKKKK